MRRREASMVSLAIILGAGLCAAPASGQWTLTVLHPSGASLSNAVSASGGQQAGWLDHRAGFWSGSADSWTDLHPAGASWSTATSAYGTQQAGYAAFGVPSLPRAGFWTDTASSWIDLHPAGANHSYAWGTSGTQQVGEVYINGSARAALWSGSAASFVDLTPAGSSAAAFAASGSRQGGATSEGAALWSGTADSYISLHPASANSSVVWGMGGSLQVGTAYFDVPVPHRHAVLWSGSPGSYVSLHPSEALESEAKSTDGVYQAGWVGFAEYSVAALWHGSAGTWENLHAATDGTWHHTIANSVWSDGEMIYVVGIGVLADNATIHALLWTRPVPLPGTLVALCAGSAALLRRTRPEWQPASDRRVAASSGAGMGVPDFFSLSNRCNQ